MRSIILFVLSMLMVTAVHAGGGFKGPGAAAIITQAKQVQDARDDAPCQLEGYIVERASGNIDDAHKKYVFRDPQADEDWRRIVWRWQLRFRQR